MIKKLLFMAMGLVAATTATAQNRLYIDDFTIMAGETKEIAIDLDNATALSALQADIFLPQGLELAQHDGEFAFALTGRAGKSHTVVSQQLTSGAVRVLVAAPALDALSGDSGALLTVPVTAGADAQGPLTIEVKNIIVSTPQREEHNLDNTSCTVTIASNEPLVLVTRMEKVKPGTQLQVVAQGVDGATWESSDATVASVDGSGLVSALKPGLAAITVTSARGESSWCAIFVYDPADVDENGVVNGSDVTTLYTRLLQ